LRLLRLLLPLLLVVLAYLLWSSWQPPAALRRASGSPPTASAPRAENLSFQEFGEGSESPVGGRARLVVPRADGSLHLEGIRDLAIQREERGPLLVSADEGLQRGSAGERHWEFSGAVVFEEPEQDLRLELPGLTVDEGTSQARASGEIRFRAGGLRGRAASLLYGLAGQPADLTAPVIEDLVGGRLTAERARLLDGIRDVELEGSVHATRPAGELTAGRVRILRGPDDRPQQMVAEAQVAGRWHEGTGRLRGDRLEARWNAAGEIAFLGLSGQALLARDHATIAAAAIEAVREGDVAGGWTVVARGGVYVEGGPDGPGGLLRTDYLRATLDAGRVLRAAEADGGVSYEGTDLRAEAERGSYVAAPEGGQVELWSGDLRKARLAQGRTRVAGRRLSTDVRGTRLEALGAVEATLLPETAAVASAQRTQLFVSGQAVHFVADELLSEGSGERLTFTGAVRGWQGERNLAASTVVVDQRTRTIEAREGVSTRIPRDTTDGAAAEADYVQIGSDRLDYDDAAGLAVYRGEVRVRLAEGWLEAERVEVDLGTAERRIREIQADGAVRLEFQRTSDGALARALNGTADRLVYRPAEATLRLFGERAPAVVRRAGEGGGTTTGRALNYDLETGKLDVESGEQGAGRIKS
jgi:lipopolysaccharide transport protein LptA